jgi:hypothetical protein
MIFTSIIVDETRYVVTIDIESVKIRKINSSIK